MADPIGSARWWLSVTIRKALWHLTVLGPEGGRKHGAKVLLELARRAEAVLKEQEAPCDQPKTSPSGASAGEPQCSIPSSSTAQPSESASSSRAGSHDPLAALRLAVEGLNPIQNINYLRVPLRDALGHVADLVAGLRAELEEERADVDNLVAWLKALSSREECVWFDRVTRRRAARQDGKG